MPLAVVLMILEKTLKGSSARYLSPECYFWTVHPLDSVKLEGVLGSAKENMIEMLDWSIDHVDESAIGRVSRVGTL